MKANNEKSRQLSLKKIKTVVVSQVNTEAAKQAALFCDVFFKRVPLTELSHESPGNFAAMAINQLEFLGQRKSGKLSIRVFNPEKARDGWEC